jgi:flagellar hook-basal body complex protein FliE
VSGVWSSSGVSGSVGLGAASAGVAGAGAAGASSAAGMPFAGVFRSMVEQTSALDEKASQAVTGLLNGQGVEIHDAMIATQKADMAFELALQVRNKAVAAYQQMMGMQF